MNEFMSLDQWIMVGSIIGAAFVALVVIKMCEQSPDPKEIQDPEVDVITVVHKLDRDKTPIEILQERLARGEIDLDTFHKLVQRC